MRQLSKRAAVWMNTILKKCKEPNGTIYYNFGWNCFSVHQSLGKESNLVKIENQSQLQDMHMEMYIKGSEMKIPAEK